MCLMTDPENYGALSDIKNMAFYLINKQTNKQKKFKNIFSNFCIGVYIINFFRFFKIIRTLKIFEVRSEMVTHLTRAKAHLDACICVQ